MYDVIRVSGMRRLVVLLAFAVSVTGAATFLNGCESSAPIEEPHRAREHGSSHTGCDRNCTRRAHEHGSFSYGGHRHYIQRSGLPDYAHSCTRGR